jgi:hypothetical protein
MKIHALQNDSAPSATAHKWRASACRATTAFASWIGRLSSPVVRSFRGNFGPQFLKRRRRRLVCACRYRSETMAEREGKSRVKARRRLESSRGIEGRWKMSKGQHPRPTGDRAL